MSHVITVAVEIRDIEAVKKMCSNLGWEFCEGKNTYSWYGRTVGNYSGEDAAVKNGIKQEDLGKCDHAIKVPGCNYSLGLKKVGDEYKLLWDSYDFKLQEAMGGEKGQKFLQEYGLALVTLEAERNGYSWEMLKLKNGDYEIEITAY